jgi:N-acetylmuramoyl-L-alanine amidase
MRYFIGGVAAMFCAVAIYTSVFGLTDRDRTVMPAGGDDPSAITAIQEKLERLGFYDGEITGIYDTVTSAAVRRYQLYMDLDGTGKADKAFLESLESQPDMLLSEYDVYMLARLIHAEAGKGSWLDMVAVGAEAVRKLGSPAYPDNLAEIIFEPGAYDCVDDGSIRNEPSDKAIRAARDAIRGMLN